MKPLKLWSLILLMSCSGPQFRPNNNPPKETPKALQDQTSDIRSLSKRTNNDLVEELYQGLAYEHTELKAIEKEIANVSADKNNLNNEFANYDYKSQGFYNAASGKLGLISDSTLKLKLSNLIQESLNKYDVKTASAKSLLKLIEHKNLSVNDYHIALMIIKTLPLIEKYQADNLPDSKLFKDMLKRQNMLIKRMDSLATKN